MARTSPVHYIAPSAISITPNANGSQRDMAVYVAKGAKIKVCYQPIADLAYDDANVRQWTLRGRNRRLADASVPYTIYARLKKTDTSDGYLVFAPQTKDAYTGIWQDPYILSPNTSATSAMRAEGADEKKYLWGPVPERQAANGRSDYWWIKLGTVSLADTGGQRTVDLDTGTLGTDQYNKDWYLDPDKMPQRPVRIIYVERGEWAATPMATYTGETGSMAPDGTLPVAVAQALGWEGTDVLTFTTGQQISEPYHFQHLTRCRWLTHRLAEYNAGYTDAELYEELTTPSSGWEEENWEETSRVWRDGRLLECLVDGATDVPSEASLQWKLLLQGGEDAYNVELTKSSDAVVIDPSGNVVGGYRTVSKDSSGNEFYTYRFHTSVTVMKGGEYLHLCGALDDGEELGDGNFTVDAVGAGCDLKVEGSTCYITFIWHCNDGDASTDPYTSYNRTPEDYQLMRAMTEAVAHITLNIEGRTSVTKDYRLQLVHLPTDTITIESHNEIAALNWSTKKNAWTNRQDIVIPLTALSGGQPVRFQTVNGGTAPDIRLLNKPGWLSGTPGYSVAWADYDEDGDGRAEYTASQHMSVEITIPIANILRTWQENGTAKEIPTTNLLKFNVTTVVDGVEYENVVPFTLNVTTDRAVYVLAPSVRQVTGTMIGGTWDPQTNTVKNARYSYVAAGEACNKVTCKLMCYDQNDNLTEITSAAALHDNLTFFINGAASTLEGFRTTGVENTPVGSTGHNLFDELSEIVFAVKMDGKDYESEGVPILRNGASLSIGDDGNWYIGGVNTEVFAKGTEVTGTFIYYTDPTTASTPPTYSPATDADRGRPDSTYKNLTCPAAVEGKFIHYVSITVFSDSEQTYVYSYGTIGTGNTITVIHDRDFYASPSELTQAQLKAIPNASWSESTPANYSSTNKYLYSRDTARYYKNGAAQTVTVGGISYPRIVYTMLAYWGQDGSGVEFAYYRAADDSQANKPSVAILNQNHAGTAKNPVIADWNGADGGWYDDNPGFTAQGQVMYQSVNKYSNGTWSGWQDPVIIDRYAKNSVRLDIDNETDMVQTDSTGKIIAARTVSTVVHLYDGAKEVDISGATLSVSGGPASTIATYETPTASGKGKKLSWTFKKDQQMADAYNISIYYTYPATNGTTYYATFTVAASKGQAVFQLKPSQSSIVYSRQSNNTLSSANNVLTLDVVKLDKGSTDTKAATAGNLTAFGLVIRYSLTAMPTSTDTSSSVFAWPDTNSLTVASTTDSVYIAMFSPAGVLLDRETVPVVCDGTNGKNADVQASLYASVDNSAGSPSAPSCTAANYMAGIYPTGWYRYVPNRQEGYGVWLSQNTIIQNADGTYSLKSNSWSSPVKISGDDGDPGTDAKEREWIYIGKDAQTTFTGNTHPKNIGTGTVPNPNGTGRIRSNDTTKDDFVPTAWSDNAVSTDDTNNRYVYASWRDWDKTTERWGDFNDPILWSNWGRQGIDGDGVQYIFKLFATKLTDAQCDSDAYKPKKTSQDAASGEWLPVTVNGVQDNSWKDNPVDPTDSMRYCYCSTIKRINGVWGDYEKLSLWSYLSKDGADGSALVVDLTNRNISIPLDENGHLQNAMSLTTAVQAFLDTTEVPNVTVTDTADKVFSTANGNNVIGPYTITASGKTVSIAVAAWTQSDMTALYAVTTIDMKVTCRDASINLLGERTVTLSLTAFKSGGVGENAMFCDLMPQPGVLKFARTASGGYDPSSRTLIVYLKSVNGNNAELKLLSETNYTCRYSYDNFPATTSDGTVVQNSRITGISPANGSTLYLSLFSGTTRIDFEDVPIVSDGSDANEINPNILLRTLFPSISNMQEKWEGNFSSLNSSYTPTPDSELIQGRNIIRSEQSSATEVDIYQDVTLQAGTWYTFSFWLRQGTTPELGNITPQLKLFMSAVGTLPGCVSEGTIDGSVSITSSDGYANISNGTWTPTRHVITFKTVSSMTGVNGGCIRFRFFGGINVISMPKLEIGQAATAYVANEDDLKGADGENAVLYEIFPSIESVRVDSDAASVTLPSAPVATFYRIDGNNRSASTLYWALKWKRGTAYTAVTPNGSGGPDSQISLPTTYSKVYDALVIFVYASSSTSTTQFLAKKEIYINVMGNTGAQGKMGRFYYYAGEFDDKDEAQTFIVNDAQAPYFSHGINSTTRLPNCHVFNPASGGTFTMKQMWTASSSSWNNAPWIPFTNNFEFLMSRAVFTDFAKLGSAVFNKDWLISQYGQRYTVLGSSQKSVSAESWSLISDSTSVTYLEEGQAITVYLYAKRNSGGSFLVPRPFICDSATYSWDKGQMSEARIVITSLSFDTYEFTFRAERTGYLFFIGYGFGTVSRIYTYFSSQYQLSMPSFINRDAVILLDDVSAVEVQPAGYNNGSASYITAVKRITSRTFDIPGQQKFTLSVNIRSNTISQGTLYIGLVYSNGTSYTSLGSVAISSSSGTGTKTATVTKTTDDTVTAFVAVWWVSASSSNVVTFTSVTLTPNDSGTEENQSFVPMIAMDWQSGYAHFAGGNARFNPNGDVYVKGDIHATSGEFTGTIHANDGEFNGTVHSELFYSPTYEIKTSSYTVDPASNPRSCYVWNKAGTCNITLPSATTYDGIQLQFLSMGVKGEPSATAEIKVVSTTYAKGSSSSQLISRATEQIPSNRICTLKAVLGKWIWLDVYGWGE